MAKVKTFKRMVSEKETRIDVVYESRSSLFKVNLPEELESFRVAAGIEEIEHRYSIEGFEKSLDDLITRYNCKTTKKRMVIVYSYSSDKMRCGGQSAWGSHGKMLLSPWKANLSWQVFEERMMGGNARLCSSDDEMDTGRPISRGEQVMVWTKEREAAMNKMDIALEILIDELDGAFKDPEKLVEYLNKKALLPPMSATEKWG